MFSYLKKLAMFSALFMSTQGYADKPDFGFGVETMIGASGGISSDTYGSNAERDPVGGPGAGLGLYFRAPKFYIGVDGYFEYDAFRGLQGTYVSAYMRKGKNKNGLGLDLNHPDSNNWGFRWTIGPMIGLDLTHHKSIWLGWHFMDQNHVFAKLKDSKEMKSIFKINAVKVAYKWTIAPYFQLHLEYALGKLKSYSMKSESLNVDEHRTVEKHFMHLFKVAVSFPMEFGF